MISTIMSINLVILTSINVSNGVVQIEATANRGVLVEIMDSEGQIVASGPGGAIFTPTELMGMDIFRAFCPTRRVLIQGVEDSIVLGEVTCFGEGSPSFQVLSFPTIDGEHKLYKQSSDLFSVLLGDVSIEAEGCAYGGEAWLEARFDGPSSYVIQINAYVSPVSACQYMAQLIIKFYLGSVSVHSGEPSNGKIDNILVVPTCHPGGFVVSDGGTAELIKR